MGISYGELAVIEGMTANELVAEWHELVKKEGHNYTQDDEDTQSAIEIEMEERGLPHPIAITPTYPKKQKTKS